MGSPVLPWPSGERIPYVTAWCWHWERWSCSKHKVFRRLWSWTWWSFSCPWNEISWWWLHFRHMDMSLLQSFSCNCNLLFLTSGSENNEGWTLSIFMRNNHPSNVHYDRMYGCIINNGNDVLFAIIQGSTHRRQSITYTTFRFWLAYIMMIKHHDEHGTGSVTHCRITICETTWLPWYTRPCPS